MHDRVVGRLKGRHQVRPSRSLAVAGLLSAGIYVMLAARLPWWRYGGVPQSWAELLGKELGTFALCLGVTGMLMVLYVWGMRFTRAGNSADRWIIWTFACVFAVALLWLLPITSDLFAYLRQAHMLTDLGANPLLQAPADVADSLVQTYSTLYDTRPTVYGPAWVLLSAVGTSGSYDLPIGLLYLKGLSAAAFLAAAWLVERLLLELRPCAALEGLYFFAWNPLVLLMAVGDGHNDIVLVALVLLALWLLLRERWALSFAVLVLSVWVKYVSLVLVPLFGLYLWRSLVRRQGSGRLHPVVSGGLAAISVSLLVVAPLCPPEALAGIVERLLHPLSWHLDSGRLPTLALGTGLCLYCLAYILIVVRFWRGSGSFQHLVNSSFLALLLIFIFGAARSQPWHLLWPAAVAGLSDNRWARGVVLGLAGVMLAVQIGVEWGMPGLRLFVD